MKKWIDWYEWNYNLAWRHYQYKKLSAFGIQEMSKEEIKEFKKQYSEKYPKNAKILKLI